MFRINERHFFYKIVVYWIAVIGAVFSFFILYSVNSEFITVSHTLNWFKSLVPKLIAATKCNDRQVNYWEVNSKQSNMRLWTLLTTDYGQKERRDPVQKHLRDATYQSVGVADIIAVKYLSIRLIIIYKLQKGVLYGSMMGRPLFPPLCLWICKWEDKWWAMKEFPSKV